MSLREAAQMALEALTYAWHEDEAHPESKAIIGALRDALAEKAEPVDEEVIGEYGWQGTSRQWWTGGAWLEPDDVVIVRRAAATETPAALPELSDKELYGAIGRAWCHPGNDTKEVDVTLATAIVKELRELAAARG